MEKLYEYLKGDEWVVIITAIISLYVAIVSFFMSYVRGKRHYRRSKQENAYDLIKKGIEEGSFDNDGDIFLVYKKLAQGDYQYNSYADFLESFLIYIRKNSDKDTILLISKRITPILNKEREEKPYCNIKDRERRILLAIDDAFKKNGTNSIKHTLIDLSMVIESNQKALDRARRTNRWSIPISIVGVLLTLFIWLYGSSLSERDIERISTHISNTISEQVIVEQPDSVSSSLTKIDQ